MFLATPSMHGIAAITGNMHRSLRYFVLLWIPLTQVRLESSFFFQVRIVQKFPGSGAPCVCMEFAVVSR